jgi:hypothetical protein
MATAKDAHALTSYYLKGYQEAYGVVPSVNRNVAKAQFGSMLMDLSGAEVRELIDYFFQAVSSNNHKIDDLFYKYDKLIQSMEADQADVKHKSNLLEESRIRAESWQASKKGSK